MRHHNKPTVFRGKHGRGWFWACPTMSENCRAQAFETHGSANHWELALLGAMEHVRDHHVHVVALSHDCATPPGGFKLGENDVTLSMKAIIA